MKNKKISIITGVAGTIGSNLAKYLIKKNHQVYGFDNLILGTLKNIYDLKKNKNFKFFKVDVSNESHLQKINLKNIKVDYLWLLAANSDIRAGIKDYKVDLQNTFMTTLASLNFFKKKLKKNSKIIFSSSSAVYGNYKNKFNEKEKKLVPISNYGENKLLSELYIKRFCIFNKLKFLIFRFPNVVGKPFTHGVIFDLANKLKKNKILRVLGDGSQKKPYVHVEELIKCMFFLSIKKNDKHNTYLLGPNDNGVEVKEIAKNIKLLFKSNKKIEFGIKKIGWTGDVPIYSYNTSRLQSSGFSFKNSSLEAVKKAIKEKYLS